MSDPGDLCPIRVIRVEAVSAEQRAAFAKALCDQRTPGATLPRQPPAGGVHGSPAAGPECITPTWLPRAAALLLWQERHVHVVVEIEVERRRLAHNLRRDLRESVLVFEDLPGILLVTISVQQLPEPEAVFLER